MKLFLSFLLLLPALTAGSQPAAAVLDSFVLFGDVVITIDRPANYKKGKATLIILYGLPNGSTTAHTMGRKWTSGDDHRYDIQHIRAQTVFLRKSLKEKNLVVCYLENNYHSWPLWKQRHPDAERLVQAIVDTLYNRFEATDKSLYLNGHSGGGRFIFTYLDSVKEIPSRIRSITFLDSNYGYDSTYTGKFVHWLSKNPDARLNVFAYNDSIALYNGKPLVSSKGGTWF